MSIAAELSPTPFGRLLTAMVTPFDAQGPSIFLWLVVWLAIWWKRDRTDCGLRHHG